MPIDYGSRNITAGGSSPYIPMVTNNPAFQVKIIPVDGAMEQKPNQKNDASQQEAIKVGDTIRGEEVSKTRKRGKQTLGRVIGIEHENQTVVAYKIINQRGKEVLVDPTTATKMDDEGLVGAPNTNPNEQYAPKEKVLLYEEWKFNQVK
jgi:hypothetical protein